MNTEPLNYLKNLDKLNISNEELLQFIALAEKEYSKEENRRAIEYFLKSYDIDPSHITELIQSNLVKQSITLQHLLKRYIKDREFKEAQVKSDNEPVWKKIFYSFGGLY